MFVPHAAVTSIDVLSLRTITCTDHETSHHLGHYIAEKRMKLRRDTLISPIFDDETGYEFVMEVFDREEYERRLCVLDKNKTCILEASCRLYSEWTDATRQSMNVSCVLLDCYIPGNAGAPGMNVPDGHPLLLMVKEFLREYWVSVAQKGKRINFKLTDQRTGKR